MACISSVMGLTYCPTPSMGGLRAIIWAPRSYVVFSYDSAPNHDVSLNSSKAYRIVGRGSYSLTAQVGEDGGVYYRQEVTFTPAAGDHENHEAFLSILAAAADDDLVVIAEDNTGMFHVLGAAWSVDKTAIIKTPVFLASGSLQTGTEKGDFHGAQVTIASVFPVCSGQDYVQSGPSISGSIANITYV